MSLGKGTVLKQVSEVKFIDADLWPENDNTPLYRRGETIKLTGYYFVWSSSSEHDGYNGYCDWREKSLDGFAELVRIF